MTYREYPDNPHTFIVHHTEGTGEQGGAPIVEKEIVFSCDLHYEAVNWGRKHYPRVTGWEWDSFTINVNTLTVEGKRLLQEFRKDFEVKQQHIKDNPKLYSYFTFKDGTTMTIVHNEAFDGPKKEGT